MDKGFLEDCLAKGMSLKQIAAITGRAPGTVGYWIRKHGLVALGSGKFDPNKQISEGHLRDRIESGWSASRVACELGLSTQTVIRRLDKLGIETVRARRAALIADARSSGQVTIELECKHHGMTVHWVGKDKVLCHRCNSVAVAKRRRKVKQILVDEAGGKCNACGYDRTPAALHFHHLDPKGKAFNVSGAGVTRSIASLRAEAEKCILLCSNCHAEVEIGARRLD